MIEISKVEWFNIEGAIRGMRNPLNSWAKSDTKGNEIGPNDLDLCKRLIKGGSEHRKFLRQIFVCMDINAPLYWWKEFDTYKVGTVANSCSTMHKIHSKEFVLEDFSTEHLNSTSKAHLLVTINLLNDYRKEYIETKGKDTWWQLIQLLPSSYNQKRTITMNYENILNMLHQRSHHKLDEWKKFCDIMRLLPYMKDFEGVLNEK